MYQIERTREVPYTAAEMFALVNDIPSYPRFLPWCDSAEVHHASLTEMEASLSLRKGPFRQSFRTHNELVRDRSIHLTLKEGPFRSLSGHWHFSPRPHGCQVDFQIAFEFASPFMDKMAGPVLAQLTETLVEAFEQRAKEQYGER